MKVVLRAPYNYDVDAASAAVLSDTVGESLTKQSFADECDINKILERFSITGHIPEGVRAPTFGDFTNIPTYQDALNAVIEAENSFMAMPAEVRSRFGNSAHAFVEFCSDPANLDEMRRLGLAVQAVTPPATVAPGAEVEGVAQSPT